MNITELRAIASSGYNRTITVDTPVMAKWLKLSEDSLQQRGLLPGIGEIIKIEQKSPDETIYIDRRPEGVFLHTNTATIQINGDTVTVH